MPLAHVFDPLAALIVLGGTALATVLRAGRADCRATLQQVAALLRRPFDPEAVRGALAPLARDIGRDGVFRTRARPSGDAAFDAAIRAMVEGHSAAMLMMQHGADRKRRLARAQRAALTMAQAADLAPVFGLAGTLVSLARLSDRGVVRAEFLGAISLAVLATLYGLLLANFVLAPIARAIERRAEREEAERQDLIDWIAAQFAAVAPRLRRGAEAA